MSKLLSLPELEAEYTKLKSANIQLDLTRGKPAADQLDLSNGLDGILAGDYSANDGTDARNYGGIRGLAEAKRLGGWLLGVDANDVIVGDNSSLLLMYLFVDTANRLGVHGPASAWQHEANARGGRVKFLCPVPGYDRHFAICEQLDIEMIPVAMNDNGPDMARIEQWVTSDPLIKGIWCVPKYSNPTGCTYSDEVVRGFAHLPKRAGANFRIMWDNAYSVHDLDATPPQLDNLLQRARENGTEDAVVMTTSTSKITFAGGGISFIASSPANLAALEKRLSVMMVGPDKVNHLRHARMFPDQRAIRAHMAKHAEFIRPKFAATLRILEQQLSGLEVAQWTKPHGGYFISVDTQPGLARAVVALAGALGVKITPAGATFPLGEDPLDRNIRIAPTFPTLPDVENAVQVLTLCIKLAAARQRAGLLPGPLPRPNPGPNPGRIPGPIRGSQTN